MNSFCVVIRSLQTVDRPRHITNRAVIRVSHVMNLVVEFRTLMLAALDQ